MDGIVHTCSKLVSLSLSFGRFNTFGVRIIWGGWYRVFFRVCPAFVLLALVFCFQGLLALEFPRLCLLESVELLWFVEVVHMIGLRIFGCGRPCMMLEIHRCTDT